MGNTLTPIAVDLSALRAVMGSGDQVLLKRLTRKFKKRFVQIDEIGDELENEVLEGPEVDQADLQDKGRDLYLLLVETAKTTGRSLGELMEHPTPALRRKSAELEKLVSAGPAPARPKKMSKSRVSGGPRATAPEALRHLILGENQDRRVGFKYGCVVRCLCGHFGEELNHDEWYDLRRGSSWFQELDGVLKDAGVPDRTFSIRKHLQQRGSPVPIPRYSDFPSIGYLRGAEVTRALAALKRADFDGTDDLARQYLGDVRGWLQDCADSGRDLVCFYD